MYTIFDEMIRAPVFLNLIENGRIFPSLFASVSLANVQSPLSLRRGNERQKRNRKEHK